MAHPGRTLAAAALAAAALLSSSLPPAHGWSGRRTPVMGWSTWSVYGCDISEQQIKEQALAMDTLGLKDLGYTYMYVQTVRCVQLVPDWKGVHAELVTMMGCGGIHSSVADLAMMTG